MERNIAANVQEEMGRTEMHQNNQQTQSTTNTNIKNNKCNSTLNTIRTRHHAKNIDSQTHITDSDS